MLHSSTNRYKPIIDEAARQSERRIRKEANAPTQGRSPVRSITQAGPDGYTRHAFVVGLDALDDARAVLLSDGQIYDFGD